MYATVYQITFTTLASADARGRTGRSLASALAALPGFLAFIALESEPNSGAVTLLCLFDRQARYAAECVIARWQQDERASVGPSIQRLGAGAVIAQRGL
jgi:hypothetical protein